MFFEAHMRKSSYFTMILGQLNAKMDPRWRQDGAKMASRWRQDGPCGAKMVLRWATWRALGSNLVTFAESWARPLQKSDQLQNPRKTR